MPLRMKTAVGGLGRVAERNSFGIRLSSWKFLAERGGDHCGGEGCLETAVNQTTYKTLPDTGFS